MIMKNEIFDVVCFGEILWDILPSGPRPGGAPMNVCYHLKKLGVSATLISRVGLDTRGEELLGLLRDNQISTDFVQEDATFPTGVVMATPGELNEVCYEIVQPVAWDFIAPEERLTLLVNQASYFIYGSLVARDIHSRKTLMELISCAHTKVVDINLRPPHFEKNFIELLLTGADILKLNEHELPLISSWYHSTQETDEQVKFIQDRFSIPVVLVTKGGHGAMVCNNGFITQHPGYPVKVADTIGSGDAFLAGFLYKYRKQSTMLQSLEFANAMGAYMASRSGACPEYLLEEIHHVTTQALVE